MIKNPGLGLFDTVLIQILGKSENLLVTVGGVTAKIYRSDTGGYVSWLVRYFVDGKAKSLRATSLKQARSKAKRELESGSAPARPTRRGPHAAANGRGVHGGGQASRGRSSFA